MCCAVREVVLHVTGAGHPQVLEVAVGHASQSRDALGRLKDQHLLHRGEGEDI